MKPIVNRLERDYGRRVNFVWLDAARPDVHAVEPKLGSRHPAIFIIDKRQGFFEKKVGIQEEKALRSRIELVLSR